jgi:Macrocin-O-methyltransferase (TylF)
MSPWTLTVKKSILRLGGVSPESLSRQLRRTCDLIDTGRWLRKSSLYPPPASFDDNQGLFDLIARKIQDKVVLYLEFGVFEGNSIRYWSKLLKNPGSMLHGFDSFEGLPETFKDDHPKGRFALRGKLPEFSDPRIRLFRGWFHETLPLYTMPPHQELVINIDCDLYSSTSFVLNHFKETMPIGAWLYFDEFGSWDHESRAFRDFLGETQMKFELIGESAAAWSAAFRRVG